MTPTKIYMSHIYIYLYKSARVFVKNEFLYKFKSLSDKETNLFMLLYI